MDHWSTKTGRALFRSLALGSVILATTPILQGGERIILEDEPGISLPNDSSRLKALEDGSAFFDRRKSSVEAVVAPWQGSSSTPKLDKKRRKALLEALDRKSNWALQTSEDLLEAQADKYGGRLEEDEFLTTDSSSKGLVNDFLYGDLRPGSRKKSALGNRGLMAGTGRGGDSRETGDTFEEDAQSKNVADVFGSSDRMRKDMDAMFKPTAFAGAMRQPGEAFSFSQRDLAAASLVGLSDLVPDEMRRNSPNHARIAGFQSILDTAATGRPSEETETGRTAAGGPGERLAGAGASWDPGRGQGSSSLILSGQTGRGFDVNSQLNALNRADTSGAFSGSVFDSPGRVGGLGGAPLGGSSAESVFRREGGFSSPERPIFFEVPRPSF